ncbi:MAG: radical SAM protein [Euryarchaeota archaeon]|nr:radical SAM protein [Euryarchaeota archaeon]
MRIEKIRMSVGTAAVLGFIKMEMFATPTTAYLLTYYPGKCTANCQFCAQARESKASGEIIARAIYPVYSLIETIPRIKATFESGILKRVCIQTINYPNMHEDVLELVRAIKECSEVPITVSRHPCTKEELEQLAQVGVDRIVIPLDAASERVFDKIKGRSAGTSYYWEKHFKALKLAKEIFKGEVGTHLIIGLGETEKEAVEIIQELSSLKIKCSLFAFTPIKGTRLEKNPRPNIGSYRRIQLAQCLIESGVSSVNNMLFGEDGTILNFGVDEKVLERVIKSGAPFIPYGCPGCNRPFATEKPSGVLYNFPQLPTEFEIERIEKELNLS